MRVNASTGKAHRKDAVRASDETIVITLPENLPRGTQVVSYRVISADGHPAAGSSRVSIGAVWGVGGSFFAPWVGETRSGSTRIIAATVVGLFSAAASVGLDGLDVLDLPL